MAVATAAPVAPALDEQRIDGYVPALVAVSEARALVGDTWGAVSAQLTVDSLVAAVAVARTGEKVSSGVHSATVDPHGAFDSAADFVSAQRVVLAALLPEAAAQTFFSMLSLLPHLQALPCPSRADTDAAPAELLGGLDFPERQAYLRLKAAKLAAVTELLRGQAPTDFARAVYRSDLLVFELAVIDIAAATGDQHLATARVKMLLAQATLTIALGQRGLADPGAAIDLVRRVLVWCLLGSRDQLDWLVASH